MKPANDDNPNEGYDVQGDHAMTQGCQRTDLEYSKENAELRADNARLRATINGMVEKGMDDLTMVAAFQVNEELRDDNARLRAFAQYVADIDPDNPAPLFAKARAVLKDTKP